MKVWITKYALTGGISFIEAEQTLDSVPDGSMIDESSDDDCGKLHEKDTVICNQCEGGWSGQKVASILAKRLHLVTCPTCKGKGVVAGEESAP